MIKLQTLMICPIARAVSLGVMTLQLMSAVAHAQSAQPENSTLFPTLNNPLFSTQTLFNQQPTSTDQKQTKGSSKLQLSAHLTDTSPALKSGVTWRVFASNSSTSNTTIIATSDQAEPQLSLPVGTFAVNVTFGLAHLTHTIVLNPGDDLTKKFVINAGGLKVLSQTQNSGFVSSNAIRFDLLSDDRDQFGQRKSIMNNVRPGKITRLNSGIYQIVSRAGDANAIVSSEVTVEAGKLTEATVIHETAKVTLKLVRSRGGDAMADTQWTIKDNIGKTIKQSAGALPSHILAPGRYTVTATSSGKAHTRAFLINNGDNVEVEIVIN